MAAPISRQAPPGLQSPVRPGVGEVGGGHIRQAEAAVMPEEDRGDRQRADLGDAEDGLDRRAESARREC